VATRFRSSGSKVLASTLGTTSANTWPLRHRMPNTVCLAVPRPRLSPLARTVLRLFLQLPPKQVSSISIAPSNIGGISCAMDSLTRVNMHATLALAPDELLGCPRRNQCNRRFYSERERCKGDRFARHSYLQTEHLRLPRLMAQLLVS